MKKLLALITALCLLCAAAVPAMGEEAYVFSPVVPNQEEIETEVTAPGGTPIKVKVTISNDPAKIDQKAVDTLATLLLPANLLPAVPVGGEATLDPDASAAPDVPQTSGGIQAIAQVQTFLTTEESFTESEELKTFKEDPKTEACTTQIVDSIADLLGAAGTSYLVAENASASDSAAYVPTADDAAAVLCASMSYLLCGDSVKAGMDSGNTDEAVYFGREMFKSFLAARIPGKEKLADYENSINLWMYTSEETGVTPEGQYAFTAFNDETGEWVVADVFEVTLDEADEDITGLWSLPVSTAYLTGGDASMKLMALRYNETTEQWSVVSMNGPALSSIIK